MAKLTVSKNENGVKIRCSDGKQVSLSHDNIITQYLVSGDIITDKNIGGTIYGTFTVVDSDCLYQPTGMGVTIPCNSLSSVIKNNMFHFRGE